VILKESDLITASLERFRYVEIGGKKFDCAGIDGPRPWDKVEEWDKNVWYGRFLMYMDLPPERRSKPEAWRIYQRKIGADDTKKIPANWSWMSKDGYWYERAKAYDDWIRESAEVYRRERNLRADEESRQKYLEVVEKHMQDIVENMSALEAMFHTRRREKVDSRWTLEELRQMGENPSLYVGTPKSTIITLRPTVRLSEVIESPMKAYEIERMLRGLPPIKTEPVAVAATQVNVNVEGNPVPWMEYRTLVGEMELLQESIANLMSEKQRLLNRVEQLEELLDMIPEWETESVAK